MSWMMVLMNASVWLTSIAKREEGKEVRLALRRQVPEAAL
jgi:hypothetical protein